MSLYAQFASTPKSEGDKKPIIVPVPNAHAGIASALKASYSALPIDEQFKCLLGKIK